MIQTKIKFGGMMKIERIEAFSDGVFAILITILVMKFNVPSCQAGSLKTAISQQWPEFVAYLMTFSYIGILWLFHNDLFKDIKQTDARVNILNLLSLFITTLLSYSMSLLAASLVSMNLDDLRFSIIFYASLGLGISLSYYLLYMYLSKNTYLLKSSESSSQFRTKQRYPLLSILVYSAAIITAVFSIKLALIFLLVGITFHYVAYWKVEKRKKPVKHTQRTSL